ncbi:hypothetical protein STXM2123_5589 [Streptomyces sp. F-3]|nr:hypothetical protein STXM2123_5589 [Streptomyces sp. F-3]
MRRPERRPATPRLRIRPAVRSATGSTVGKGRAPPPARHTAQVKEFRSSWTL